MARLPEQARDVLYAFAVLGADHDPAIVGSLLELSPTTLAPLLDALIVEDLLVLDAGGRLGFRHALTRDAVYESIPPVLRRDLHARCVDAIDAHEGLRAAAAMAEHLQQVGGVEQLRRAGTLLAQAGEQSLAQLAYEQAATQLGDAVRLLLECGEDAALIRHTRLQLAEALRRTHADDTALDAFALVADEAAAGGGQETEAQAALGYEQTYLETGRARTGAEARSIPLLDRAFSHLNDAAASASDEVAPLRARLLAAGAQARHFAGERDAALDMARQAAEVARAGSVPGAEAAALNTLRLATTGPDTLDETLDLTRQIVERAAEAGDVDLELEGLLWRIIALLEVGRRSESEAALGRFATLAQRVRHPWRLSEMHRMQGMFAHLNGDRALARSEAETALRFGLAAGHAEARSPYVVMLEAVAGPAEVRLAVEALLQQRTPELTTFRWQLFVGWLALISGDRDRAMRLGGMAMDSGVETLPRDQSWLTFLYPFAELAIRLGQPAWAQAAYDALLPCADRYIVSANAALCAGSVELQLARLAEATGTADAAAHRTRADERNELIGARVWLEATTPDSTRVTKTFMFTDIVGSTNLAELLGDEAWGTLLRWHDQTLGELFRAHGGEQVVSTGDGFFVAFEDAEGAIACAVAIQRRLAEHRQSAGFAPEVRIGLHTAEATAEDQNYKGLGVHEAARISALANGGEILASAATAGSHAAPGSARATTLKGVAEPVEIADIPWR